MPLNSIPATVDVAASETKRAAAAGSSRSTSASGAARSPATLLSSRRCTRRGRRLQVLPAASGVDEFPRSTRRSSALAMRGDRRLRRPADRPRRGPGRHRLGARAARAAATSTSSPRVRRWPRCARSSTVAADAARPAAAPTSCTSRAPRPCRLLARREGRGAAGHRRDLPALSGAARRGRSRRARPSSSAARRSATTRTATCSGRGCSTARSTASSRTTPLHGRAEAPRHRRLRRGLGRHRLTAARAAGGVDRRLASAASACQLMGWMADRSREAHRAHRPRRDCRRQSRRLRRLRPGRAVHRRSRAAAAPQPRQSVSRSDRSTASSSRRGWSGSPIEAGETRGRLVVNR